MSLKGKRLYHGSARTIKGNKLKPHKACRINIITSKKICDRKPKVYTTSNEQVALLFASKVPYRDATIRKDGKVVIFMNKKYLNRLRNSGHIYEVDKAGFKKGPRTKYDEYVNNKKVKIINKTFIPSVYKAVMKDKNIVLVLE